MKLTKFDIKFLSVCAIILTLCLLIAIHYSRKIDSECQERANQIVKEYPQLSKLYNLLSSDRIISVFDIMELEEAAEKEAIKEGLK